MKMTVELLAELGGCGDYTNRFLGVFPKDEYPDGVEINAEVCLAHANQFPWSWAVENMLSDDGATAYYTRYQELNSWYATNEAEHNEAIRRWRTKYNVYYESDARGEAREEYLALKAEYEEKLRAAGYDPERGVYDQMSARAFGETFEQSDANRHRRIARAQEAALERASRELIAEHDTVVRQLEQTRVKLANLQEQLPTLEAREAELAVRVAPARAKIAEGKAELAAQREAELVAQLERARATTAEARAEAERLRAEADATSTESSESDASVSEADAATASA